jgi:lysyl-tRNA synthetase, class II
MDYKEYKLYGFDDNKMLKREKLLNSGLLYPYSFNLTHKVEAAIQEAVKYEKKHLPLDGITVSLAGRVWSLRNMGKSFFFDLKDETNKIQVYCKKDLLSEYEWNQISLLDIGDIVGMTGYLFRTNTHELSVHATTILILTKTVVQIPLGKETDDKIYNRVSDPEVKYRERYLHWMVNNDDRNKMMLRFRIITEIRNWMEAEGFLEVTTPNIEMVYGGAEARPFKTNIWALDHQEAFLRISPELYLKRYIVAGFPKVFTICQNFRNEGIDSTHNPEFTMMEWYEAFTDYEYQMYRFEMLVSHICLKICGDTQITYQGTQINFAPPWKRLSMLDALKQYEDVDANYMTDDDLRGELTRRNITHPEPFTWGYAVVKLFEATCEEHLVQPTFLIDHPSDISPMTKAKRGDPRLVERFEPFIYGMEMGNAYSEMNDPILQLKEFIRQKEDQIKRQNATSVDYTDNPIDIDFIKAIGCGLPPTGGVGLGIDRLIMLFTNSISIREIIPFPMIKPNNDSL